MKNSLTTKLLSVLAVLMAVLMAFSGCGDNTTTADASSAEDVAGDNQNTEDTDNSEDEDIQDDSTSSSTKSKTTKSKTTSSKTTKSKTTKSKTTSSKTTKSKTTSSTKSKTSSKSTSSSQTSSEVKNMTKKQKVLAGLDETLYPNNLENAGNSARIANLMKKAEKGGHYVVAVLGGSISEGAGASSKKSCYGYLMSKWWEENFPNSTFTFVNAGIGSTNPEMACYRLESDLLQYNPDFVVIDFSVNTYLDGNLDNTYSSLIYRILSRSNSPAVLAIQFTHVDSTLYKQGSYKKAGTFPAAEIKNAVQDYQIPSLSYHNYVWYHIEKRTITWNDIGSDYIHPNDNGHCIAAALITAHLDYVKENMNTLAGTPPTISKTPQSKYLNFGYFTTDSKNVTSNGFSAKDTNNGATYHSWYTNKSGSTITFTVPDGVKAIKVFLNFNGNTGSVDVTSNGAKITSIACPSPSTPTLAQVSVTPNSKVTLTTNISGGNNLYLYGIGYSK